MPIVPSDAYAKKLAMRVSREIDDMAFALMNEHMGDCGAEDLGEMQRLVINCWIAQLAASLGTTLARVNRENAKNHYADEAVTLTEKFIALCRENDRWGVLYARDGKIVYRESENN